MSHCLHPLHVKLPGAHVPEKSTVGPIGSHYLSFLFKDCLPTFYRVLAGPKVYINFMPPNIQMDEKQWNKWQIASYSYIRNYRCLVGIVIIPYLDTVDLPERALKGQGAIITVVADLTTVKGLWIVHLKEVW